MFSMQTRRDLRGLCKEIIQFYDDVELIRTGELIRRTQKWNKRKFYTYLHDRLSYRNMVNCPTTRSDFFDDILDYHQTERFK